MLSSLLLIALSCHIYVVQPGDSLSTIAGRQLGDISRWTEIRDTNGLASTSIEPGQELRVCDSIDWEFLCRSTIVRRLRDLGLKHKTHNVLSTIPVGVVKAAFVLNSQKTPISEHQKLEMCRWALATAEQESNFQFAIGAAGEIGLYQFKLDTVRLTLRRYGIVTSDSDRGLVTMLLDNAAATEMFLLHFWHLNKVYGGDVRQAWRRYNGHGPAAEEYANMVWHRYQELLQIRIRRSQ